MNYFEYMARKTGAVPTEAPKARRNDKEPYPFHRPRTDEQAVRLLERLLA